MKVLLAADGSDYTVKALHFIAANKHALEIDGELLVIHVQMGLPTGFNLVMGFEEAQKLHTTEADDVFTPLQKFLGDHGMTCRCVSKIGPIVQEIVELAKKEQVHMIVMGTHGRDLIGRAVMGSVAQKVVAQSDVPVLLVK